VARDTRRAHARAGQDAVDPDGAGPAAKARSPLAAARSAARGRLPDRASWKAPAHAPGRAVRLRSRPPPPRQRHVRRLEQRADASAAPAATSSINLCPQRTSRAVERTAADPYCPPPMKARVVVTLKRSVLDRRASGGAALASLGFGEVQGSVSGRSSSWDLTRTTRAAPAIASRHVREAPRPTPSSRSTASRNRPDALRGGHLPGSTATTTSTMSPSMSWDERPATSGTRTATCAAPTWWCSGGFSYGDYCAPAPSPASRR